MSETAGTWQDVASLDDFASTDSIAVDVGRREIAIYFVGGAVFATDNRCSHGDARLCDGFLEGHEIECPHHQGRFDIRTGAVAGPPCVVPVKTYPTVIDGGKVVIYTE